MIFDLKLQEKDLYSNMIKKLIDNELIAPNENIEDNEYKRERQQKFTRYNRLLSEKINKNNKFSLKNNVSFKDSAVNVAENFYYDRDLLKLKLELDIDGLFIGRLNNILSILNANADTQSLALEKYLKDLCNEVLTKLNLKFKLANFEREIYQFENKKSIREEEMQKYNEESETISRNISFIKQLIEDIPNVNFSEFSISTLAARNCEEVFNYIFGNYKKNIKR